LGAYRLFVKNFYRGKMEATLGTHPAAGNPPFDWTQGSCSNLRLARNNLYNSFHRGEIV
jgi:hypothetical protein